MIITLKGADFSQSNIGTLSTYSIRFNSNGITNTNTSVDRETNTGYAATITFKENYELNGTITVTMGGADITSTAVSGLNINIAKVTGNVVITVPAKSTVVEPETPTNYTFTINPTPTSATVTLSATGYTTVSGAGSKSITVANGTAVSWRVSASGYTTQTGSWTANGSNKTENVVLIASEGTELEEIATTTGYYINASSLTNSTNSVFNIGKYDVSTAGRIKATCRQGTNSAAVFTDAQGVRTLAGVGNTESGVNYIVELDVPLNAVYFELTYSTQFEHSVIKLAERENVDIDSFTTIEAESTTEGYYIDKDMNNAANPSFVIGKYNVSNYSKVYVEARIGSIAYLAWTDSSGTRTQAGVGNGNTGLNYQQILTVPETAVYLEFGYSTTQPCTVKGGE